MCDDEEGGREKDRNKMKGIEVFTFGDLDLEKG